MGRACVVGFSCGGALAPCPLAVPVHSLRSSVLTMEYELGQQITLLNNICADLELPAYCSII